MLLKHLDGILNYCRTKVRFGVVEAINSNIRMLINRGRGYKNMRYLLLKAKRMVVTNTQYVAFQRIRKMRPPTNSSGEPVLALWSTAACIQVRLKVRAPRASAVEYPR
jgi:hypothetical protein